MNIRLAIKQPATRSTCQGRTFGKRIMRAYEWCVLGGIVNAEQRCFFEGLFGGCQTIYYNRRIKDISCITHVHESVICPH